MSKVHKHDAITSNFWARRRRGRRHKHNTVERFNFNLTICDCDLLGFAIETWPNCTYITFALVGFVVMLRRYEISQMSKGGHRNTGD